MIFLILYLDSLDNLILIILLILCLENFGSLMLGLG